MPRFATATVTELARVGLFQELPGEVLTKLAKHAPLEVAPGDPIVLEGEEGDDFYVILRGLRRGLEPGAGWPPRRLLRPGSYFGEVALRWTSRAPHP